MTIVNAYTELAKELSLPRMQTGGVRVESQLFDSEDRLLDVLTAAKPTQGWLQFQSQQMLFNEGLPDIKPQWGVLLSAEMVDDRKNSLKLLQNGQGAWRFLQYKEDSSISGLWDDVFHLSRDKGRLRYRRYWVNHPDRGFEQQTARFTGFELEGTS